MNKKSVPYRFVCPFPYKVVRKDNLIRTKEEDKKGMNEFKKILRDFGLIEKDKTK